MCYKNMLLIRCVKWLLYRLSRYAAFDPTAEKKSISGELVSKSSIGNIPSSGATEAASSITNPTSEASSLRKTPSSAADVHISGNDPMIFPGILSRDTSRRNLTKVDSWGIQSTELPSPGTD